MIHTLRSHDWKQFTGADSRAENPRPALSLLRANSARVAHKRPDPDRETPETYSDFFNHN
jgi:hypothetical protein